MSHGFLNVCRTGRVVYVLFCIGGVVYLSSPVVNFVGPVVYFVFCILYFVPGLRFEGPPGPSNNGGDECA